ncbi:MAG: heme exporter protein CcmD [Actinobacteria bacterium]|nr:heme exporter protein CcmD [Actinomycetota bacterium]
MTAMLNAGYVIGSYAATFGGIALYTWHLLRRARRAAEQVPPQDRPWT